MALVAWRVGAHGAVGAALVVALAAAGAAALVDARSGRLPNRLVAITALAACCGAVVVAGERGVTSAAGALSAGALGCALPLLVAHLVAPASMGFGDVKLAAGLGAAVGLVDPRFGVVTVCAGSGVSALFGLATRRRAVPFGPGLFLGAVTAMALGGRVWA